MKGLLTLYPRWWLDRYGDEMRSLLEDAPPRRRDRLDLVRGAYDAWLHPPAPSHVAGVAALIGGGAWTAVALGTVLQPMPPDWPGYLHEMVPLAILAAGEPPGRDAGVGSPGCGRGRPSRDRRCLAGRRWLRRMDLGARRRPRPALPTARRSAIGQTLAMVGTAAVGVVVIRVRQDVLGFLLVAAGTAMVIPWTPAWLAFGACWTVIGVVLEFERSARPGPGLGTA